jgi:hypothetical protein
MKRPKSRSKARKRSLNLPSTFGVVSGTLVMVRPANRAAQLRLVKHAVTLAGTDCDGQHGQHGGLGSKQRRRSTHRDLATLASQLLVHHGSEPWRMRTDASASSNARQALHLSARSSRTHDVALFTGSRSLRQDGSSL